jgi:hypothetical protein
VSEDGRADYFVTMTCNPKWPELVAALTLPDGTVQKAEDRPDLVGRVFLRRLAKLEESLKGKHVLGYVIGFVRCIEWQKIRVYTPTC